MAIVPITERRKMAEAQVFTARFRRLFLNLSVLGCRGERGDKWLLISFSPPLLVQSKILDRGSNIMYLFLNGVFHVEMFGDACIITAANKNERVPGYIAGLVMDEVVEAKSLATDDVVEVKCLVTDGAFGGKYSLVFAPPGSIIRTTRGMEHIVTHDGFQIAVTQKHDLRIR
jgi:hypothetical protein